MMDILKNYIKLSAKASGRNHKEIKNDMKTVKAKFGVTYREYYNSQLYDMTPTQQAVEARRITIRRNNRIQRLERISKATGFSHREIVNRIKKINRKKIITMSVILYDKYEVFRFEGKALDDFLRLFVRRDKLKSQLIKSFDKIDKGELSYDDIAPLLDEFYDVVEKLMPESLFEQLTETVQFSYPQVLNDAELRRKTAIDMEATRVLLPFSPSEYIAFHFAEKNLAEKREFISDKERLVILNEINDPAKFDLLDDKYQAYQLLEKYYHRKLLNITGPEDRDAFCKLCENNDKLVIKNPYETMGRGVYAIDVTDKSGTSDLFEKLLADHETFLVEELIVAHDSIKTLNPDSVNTVRMITYYDGEKSIVHDTFMKVGQKGSFIDNGGAGGLLVSIDTETGKFNTNGCDEQGTVYETHPGTGVKFMGYQLPDWDKAIALGLELSSKVPGLKYIGWDLTYTSDNQWVIVEGNAKTQFYGQQCPTDKGVREDFLKTIGYKK